MEPEPRGRGGWLCPDRVLGERLATRRTGAGHGDIGGQRRAAGEAVSWLRAFQVRPREIRGLMETETGVLGFEPRLTESESVVNLANKGLAPHCPHSGPQSVVGSAPNTPLPSPADPELAAVVAAWADLPPAVRAGVLAMVRAIGGQP